MSIEENLKSIADSLKELTEIGRLNLALAAARNSEAKTSPSTPPTTGPSEPAQTEPGPSPPATSEPVAPKRKGRPPKAATPPVEPTPEPAPEPAAVATPAVEAPTPVVEAPAPVVVETRPAPEPELVDDFLDDPKPEPTYPDPTPENVRAAYIAYAGRNGGSDPHSGGRAKARDLLLKATGFQIMAQLEAHVKATNDTSLYVKAIKAAVDG